MNFRPLLCAAALLALTPAVAAPAPSPPAAVAPQTVTLRYHWTPNETRRYTVTTDMTMLMSGLPGGKTLPVKTHEEMTLAQTCQSVRPSDGAASLLTRISTMTGTMNGKPMPAAMTGMEAFKDGFVSVTTPTGKTLSTTMNGAASGPLSKMLAHLTGMTPAFFPEQAVKVGDTWSSTVDLNAAFGGKMTLPQIVMQSTLTGLRTESGDTLADISLVIDAPLDMTLPGSSASATAMTGKQTGTGTLVFDVDKGAIVRFVNSSATHMTITPPAGAGQAPLTNTMQMEMHMERAPDTAASP